MKTFNNSFSFIPIHNHSKPDDAREQNRMKMKQDSQFINLFGLFLFKKNSISLSFYYFLYY